MDGISPNMTFTRWVVAPEVFLPLPFILHGEISICQSSARLRHTCRIEQINLLCPVIRRDYPVIGEVHHDRILSSIVRLTDERDATSTRVNYRLTFPSLSFSRVRIEPRKQSRLLCD